MTKTFSFKKPKKGDKGWWLPREEAAYALDLSIPTFKRYIAELEHKEASGHSPDLFWIGKTYATDHFKKVRKDDEVEFDPLFTISSELSGDDEDDLEVLKRELLELKKINLKVKTSALKESLQERKKALFTEWSHRFFEIFKVSFAKFKTSLVELHLDEEQVKTLESRLETALSSLDDRTFTDKRRLLK